MMTAMCAARNILGASYDLWAINTEAEYHEEETEKPAAAPTKPQRPAYAEPPLVSQPIYARKTEPVPVPVQSRAAKAAGAQTSSQM